MLRRRREHGVGYVALSIAWFAVVAVGCGTHVFWRDEVRALTLALSAPNLLGVPAAIHGDGHPALWFLLLRAAHDIVPVPFVLPALGSAVAAAAIGLFIWRAPFPLWWKPFFVFSGWAMYEYAVMDRNYGISMLLMFLIAACIANRTHIFVVALLLVMLAQTNIHSALIAPFYLMAFVREPDPSRRWRSLAICGAAVVLGLVLAAATVYPTRNDLAESVHRPATIANALLVLDPGVALNYLSDGWSMRSVAVSLLAYGACLLLLPRAELFGAAVVSLWLLAIVGEFVYPMAFRHTGLWVCFLVALYWIRFAPELSADFVGTARGSYRGLRIASLACVTVLLGTSIVTGFASVILHLREPDSDSKGLAEFIGGDPSLRDAVVVAEPEELAEALPYYASNPIYLLREGRFGSAATWSSAMIDRLSLGDVLVRARDLRARTRRPVVVILGEKLAPGGGNARSEYRLHFSYTATQVRELAADTTKIAGLRRGTLEQFDAYVLR
jgi:hypothetical protein